MMCGRMSQTQLLTDAVLCGYLAAAIRIRNWWYEKSDGMISIDSRSHSMCLQNR